jgi:S-formylglutathione hydrolase
MNCPWGEKAQRGYLGPDQAAWRGYDAYALAEDGTRLPALLVNQGTADGFPESQLKPQLLEAACAKAGIPLTMRRQEGYDHSYFFISTFAEDHLRGRSRMLFTSTP